MKNKIKIKIKSCHSCKYFKSDISSVLMVKEGYCEKKDKTIKANKICDMFKISKIHKEKIKLYFCCHKVTFK